MKWNPMKAKSKYRRPRVEFAEGVTYACNSASLLFTPTAWAKMCTLVAACQTEIAWNGLTKKITNFGIFRLASGHGKLWMIRDTNRRKNTSGTKALPWKRRSVGCAQMNTRKVFFASRALYVVMNTDLHGKLSLFRKMSCSFFTVCRRPLERPLWV